MLSQYISRTLLNKLEEVEASLEAAGGAIPKRSLRATGSAPPVPASSSSSRRSEDRMARRLHEYELPGGCKEKTSHKFFFNEIKL